MSHSSLKVGPISPKIGLNMRGHISYPSCQALDCKIIVCMAKMETKVTDQPTTVDTWGAGWAQEWKMIKLWNVYYPQHVLFFCWNITQSSIIQMILSSCYKMGCSTCHNQMKLQWGAQPAPINLPKWVFFNTCLCCNKCQRAGHSIFQHFRQHIVACLLLVSECPLSNNMPARTY